MTGQKKEAEQVRRSRSRITAGAIDQAARDKAADAINRSEVHEAQCAERWRHQAESMTRIESTIKNMSDNLGEKIGRLPAGLIAGLSGAVGWLAARAFPIH